MKCYTSFVKWYKEDKGWSFEKADRHWHTRINDPNWAKGSDPEYGQVTVFVPDEQYFESEGELSHESAVRMGTKHITSPNAKQVNELLAQMKQALLRGRRIPL